MFDVKQAVKSAIENNKEESPSPQPTSPPTPQQLRARIGESRLALELPEQRAEGYALMGEYEQAVELAPDNKEYKAVLDAINRNESESCACPKITGHGTNKVSTWFLKDEFMRRGREVKLYACSLCGFMNCI